MNGTRKLALALAFAALLAAVLTACGGGSSSSSEGTAEASGSTEAAEAGGESEGGGSEEKVNIAAFILAKENAYSLQNVKGLEAGAEALGNATVTVFDGEFNGAKQATEIQDATASGKYNAFVVFPNDGAIVAPAVEEAAAQGVKTVAAYAPIGTDISTGEPQVEGVVGTVWHPNVPNGEAIGELTVEACEQEHPEANPCQVGYISGGKEIAFEVAKQEAVERIIGEAKQKIEIVAEGENGFLVDPARTVTEDMLQAHPEINVIATSGDQGTLGAEQAINDAGKKGISLIGNGASTEAVELINEGKWFGSPVFLPIDEGKSAAEMVIEAVRGKEPAQPEVNVVEEFSTVGPYYSKADEGTKFEPQWSVNG